MFSFRNTRFAPLVSLGCLLILGYFAFHAWHGPRGYAFRDSLEIKLAQLQADQLEVVTRRTAIEARVKLMRPEKVDPDMLEELARSELGLIGPNDLLVSARLQAKP